MANKIKEMFKVFKANSDRFTLFVYITVDLVVFFIFTIEGIFLSFAISSLFRRVSSVIFAAMDLCAANWRCPAAEKALILCLAWAEEIETEAEDFRKSAKIFEKALKIKPIYQENNALFHIILKFSYLINFSSIFDSLGFAIA